MAAIVLFVVVFWSALGLWPFTGTAVEWVLGFLSVSFVNLGVGTLGCGLVIEWLHYDWSPFRYRHQPVIIVILLGLLATDVGVAWWLFASDAGALLRWIVLIVALAFIAVGAALTYPWQAPDGHRRRLLWPQADQPPDSKWLGRFTLLFPFRLLFIVLGSALGVVVAVAYLGISAWHENADVPEGPPMPVALYGIHGNYLALGDSYSSGEGLTPFAPGTAETGCDRSVSHAYPTLLVELLRRQDRDASLTFSACSGALIKEIFGSTYRPTGLVVPPQANGTIQPSVGLVTLTIGGDNAIFSTVVENCLISGDCLTEVFPPGGVQVEETLHSVPKGELLTSWGPGTIEEIGTEDAVLFRTLRRDFPNARIIVIGYPYLFPDLPAPGFPYLHPLCSSILNRLSMPERDGLRTLQDEFNNRIYEEAVAAGIEFVSPDAIWDNHEPCGSSGQYTNSVKPYLNFPDPVNGGSFHPNAAGQQALATLVACYLDKYPTRPDLFTSAGPHTITIPASQLLSSSQLGLVPAPGLDSVPGAGTIRNC